MISALPAAKPPRRAAQRLAERAGDHVDAIDHAGVLGGAAAAVAEHADAERVVDDHHRVVALGEIADRREVRDPAGERVDAVGDDRAEPRPLRAAQDVLQVVGIVAAERDQPGAGEPRALGQARVDAAVADDAVAAPNSGANTPMLAW